MQFNRHLNLEGRHALLSPSKYQWLNYDEDKIDRMFYAQMAARRGSELHDLAHQMIRLGIKAEELNKTFNMYVNDAIGFRMSPEVTLKYSEEAFGTADAICFRDNVLRVHDLKNGVSPTSMKQLELYVALFCLEYKFKPFDIQASLRIYQNDQIYETEYDPDAILHHIDKIITFDKRIRGLRMEGLS